MQKQVRNDERLGAIGPAGRSSAEHDAPATSASSGGYERRAGAAAAEVLQRRSSGRIQAKLVVGASDDAYEREADAVADRVMHRLRSPHGPDTPEATVTDDGVRRAPSADPGVMVGPEGGDLDESTSTKIARTAGRGRPLADDVRGPLESAFGSDFSNVRVHTDSDIAPGLGARAFTLGSDVHFAPGEFRPDTADGTRVLSHELTHVLQQTGGAQRSVRRAPKVIQRDQTDQQKKVVTNLQQSAAVQSKVAKKQLVKLAKAQGISADELEIIKRHIREAEVTINFNAGKMIGTESVAELIEKSGGVKNMFETGTSGGAADFKKRESVERNLMGYSEIKTDSPMADKTERPRYGAVNPTTSSRGGADTSSYGDTAFVLTKEAKQRMTLVADDTFADGLTTEDIGTFDDIDHVLLKAFTKSPELAKTILAHATGERAVTKGFGYIEAQIHGEVDIQKDVAYVRASFREAFGDRSGDALRRIAGTKPVIWNFNSRDQMVLQPTSGPAKKAFDEIWAKAVTARTDAAANKTDPGSDITKLWNDLLTAMPPSNIEVTDNKKKSLGQLSGRDDKDPAKKPIKIAKAKELQDMLTSLKG